MKKFRTSLLKFLSKYDDWEIRNNEPYESPFDFLYSPKHKLYLHLIECDERLEQIDLSFFQSMSLHCFEKKIKLIQLREEQWNTKMDFMKHRLCSIFETNAKVHARQCKIRRINKVEYDNFLNQNHLLQTAKTKFKYGLFKGEFLLAVMGISGGRWMTKEDDLRKSFEMIRFATQTNTTVVGGFSKLMKYIEEDIQVQEWMSYFDLDWVVNNVYRTLYFEIKEVTKPKRVTIENSILHTYTSGNLKLIKRIDGA